MTCKDCIHFMVCNEIWSDDKLCVLFQNKANVQEVKHGEWIPKVERGRMPFLKNYICSICGESPIGISNYCPNCGARMDGGKE